MRIIHAKTVVGQDSGDTTLIQPSDWNHDHVIDGIDYISESTSYSVNVDGSGSFPTLNAAFTYLNKCTIRPTAQITINLSDGVHTTSAECRWDNQHSLFQIAGTTPNAVTITAASITTVSEWNHTVVYTLSAAVPAGVVPGMILIYHNNCDADGSHYFNFGAHEILAVGANTITARVRNKNTPQTFTGQSKQAKIIRTVIKCGISGTSVVTAHNGGAIGHWGAPFLKNVGINGNDVNNCLSVYRGTYVSLYPGTSKTFSIPIINGGAWGVVIGDMSALQAYEGTLVVSSCQGGVLVQSMSNGYFGNFLIVTGCNRNYDDWLRAIHVDDMSDVITYSSISIDNKHTILSWGLSRVRYSQTQESHWGGTNAQTGTGGTLIAP